MFAFWCLCFFLYLKDHRVVFFYISEELIVPKSGVKILVSVLNSLCGSLPISAIIGFIGVCLVYVFLVIHKMWVFSDGVRWVLSSIFKNFLVSFLNFHLSFMIFCSFFFFFFRKYYRLQEVSFLVDKSNYNSSAFVRKGCAWMSVGKYYFLFSNVAIIKPWMDLLLKSESLYF